MSSKSERGESITTGLVTLQDLLQVVTGAVCSFDGAPSVVDPAAAVVFVEVHAVALYVREAVFGTVDQAVYSGHPSTPQRVPVGQQRHALGVGCTIKPQRACTAES